MEEKHEIEERQSSSTPPPVEEARIKNPGVAAVLSAVLPGLGQIYNGRFIWAIVWFIITPGLWIGTGGFFGWVCNILSALQAWLQAKRQAEEA